MFSYKSKKCANEDSVSSQIYGVVVADILASSARRDVRVLLGKKLTATSEKHLRRKLIRLPYTVTAGDEFQTITGELPSLPALLLDLRAALRPLPLRIGVGIGTVADRIQPPVNRLTGEAFLFARWAIENVKTGGLYKFGVLTAFASGNQDFDDTINLDLWPARHSGAPDHFKTVGGHRGISQPCGPGANRTTAQT
jgi:hypothetical protein